jgi:seryl-tRNA(Sec) selenium transferase
MPEKIGHFKDGKWVEEKEAPAPGSEQKGPETPEIEKLIGETSNSVDKAVDSVINLSKTLFMTEKGRAHIEKKVRKAGQDLEKAIDDMVETAKSKLEKKE